MKLYKIYIGFLFFLFAFVGCKDDNNPELLFDGTPAERIKKQTEKLRNTLKASENGWKITYFTDDKILGGYTFLFNFVGDEEVKMDSDFGNADPTKVSLYDITLGSTLKLTFTTNNVIHQIADGGNYPDTGLKGRGYKGDFEFLLSSYEGDDIIFRVNRDPSNFIRFKKATANDWSDLLKHKQIMNDIQNISNQWGFEINEKAYNIFYNRSRRFATNTNGDINFGVGFTKTGILIKPAIKVKDKQYAEFDLDKVNKEFVSKDKAFKIKFIEPPFDITKRWRTVGAGTVGGQPLSSPSFMDIFQQANIANQGVYPTFPLSRIITLGDTRINNQQGLLLKMGPFSLVYQLNFGGTFDGKGLTIYKNGEGFNWRFVRHLNPLLDKIVEKQPYNVEKTGSIVKLTSRSDANFWFILL